MAFSWSPLTENESQIAESKMQEIVDAIDDLEENVMEVGCTTVQMNPSGREVQNTSASDPLNEFSGWIPNVDPDFEREYVQDDEVYNIRNAIDPLYDNRSTCRVHFAADYQGYLTSVCSTEYNTVYSAHYGTYLSGNRASRDFVKYDSNRNHNDVLHSGYKMGHDSQN